MTIWPKGSPYPTIVLESGWSESWERLCNDRQLWSEGSGYAIQLIILVKMYRPNSQGLVHGKLEITSYNTQGLVSTFVEVSFLLQAAF
jgi:hypothetical protein